MTDRGVQVVLVDSDPIHRSSCSPRSLGMDYKLVYIEPIQREITP